MSVKYGIEAYFTEQDKGKDLEKRTYKGHRASLEMEVALGKNGMAILKAHRFGPMSIEVEDLKVEDNKPQSAKIVLTNISDKPRAIVDLPEYRSLKMIKSQRRWWSEDETSWEWANKDNLHSVKIQNLLQNSQIYI